MLQCPLEKEKMFAKFQIESKSNLRYGDFHINYMNCDTNPIIRNLN